MQEDSQRKTTTMYDNEAKPTEEQLKAWADDTDRNAHCEVREKIAKWAVENAGDRIMGGIMGKLGVEIKSAYGRLEDGNNFRSFDTACKLTNILLAAIEQEYGKDTAEAIGRCL